MQRHFGQCLFKEKQQRPGEQKEPESKICELLFWSHTHSRHKTCVCQKASWWLFEILTAARKLALFEVSYLKHAGLTTLGAFRGIKLAVVDKLGFLLPSLLITSCSLLSLWRRWYAKQEGGSFQNEHSSGDTSLTETLCSLWWIIFSWKVGEMPLKTLPWPSKGVGIASKWVSRNLNSQPLASS